MTAKGEAGGSPTPNERPAAPPQRSAFKEACVTLSITTAARWGGKDILIILNPEEETLYRGPRALQRGRLRGRRPLRCLTPALHTCPTHPAAHGGDRSL